MATEVIPPTRWREFLDGFSRAHRGWLVTVDSAEGPGVMMRDVPLAAILVDDGDIVIETAMDRQHTDHVVRDPVAIRLERADDGAERQIEIASGEGGLVRVRFRSAVPPELVNGVASRDYP